MKKEEFKKCSPGSPSSAVYGLGLIGASVYFLQQSTTFSEGVIGVLKAILWPAFLVHGLLGFLGI